MTILLFLAPIFLSLVFIFLCCLFRFIATIAVNASNVLSHAVNSVLMFLDILIVSYPLRLYHMIQPIAFGVAFGIFSFIYYLCGGVDM